MSSMKCKVFCVLMYVVQPWVVQCLTGVMNMDPVSVSCALSCKRSRCSVIIVEKLQVRIYFKKIDATQNSHWTLF